MDTSKGFQRVISDDAPPPAKKERAPPWEPTKRLCKACWALLALLAALVAAAIFYLYPRLAQICIRLRGASVDPGLSIAWGMLGVPYLQVRPSMTLPVRTSNANLWGLSAQVNASAHYSGGDGSLPFLQGSAPATLSPRRTSASSLSLTSSFSSLDPNSAALYKALVDAWPREVQLPTRSSAPIGAREPLHGELRYRPAGVAEEDVADGPPLRGARRRESPRLVCRTHPNLCLLYCPVLPVAASL